MACCPLRRQEAAGVHRREWVSHFCFTLLCDTLESQSSERREGIWQGPEEPRQENTTLIASITLEGVMGASLYDHRGYHRRPSL
jgi:hypothetical protein